MRETIVEGLLDDAGFGLLGVAKTAGLVHLLARQAKVSDRRDGVLVRNTVRYIRAAVRTGGDLAPGLRGVVLIGQPALCQLGNSIRSIVERG